MPSLRARSHPRIGILGNPSDGYGGRVLSLTFTNFHAEVDLSEEGPGARELYARLDEGTAEGSEALTTAAARRFARSHPLSESTRLGFVTQSNIPRQAGLAGSSAIVTAALRTLAQRSGIYLPPSELALLAWEAETQELGIVAGPQDRVAQAHGGLIDMDFSDAWAPDSFRYLDPALLPPMLVAWNPGPGAPSGEVHDSVRARYEAGDAAVAQAMVRFREFAADGVSALERGDVPKFLECMNANFDARAAIWTLSEQDRELVAIGREAGCATKFTGSGGAIVCAAPSLSALERAEEAYASHEFPTIRPEPAARAQENIT